MKRYLIKIQSSGTHSTNTLTLSVKNCIAGDGGMGWVWGWFSQTLNRLIWILDAWLAGLVAYYYLLQTAGRPARPPAKMY